MNAEIETMGARLSRYGVRFLSFLLTLKFVSAQCHALQIPELLTQRTMQIPELLTQRKGFVTQILELLTQRKSCRLLSFLRSASCRFLSFLRSASLIQPMPRPL